MSNNEKLEIKVPITEYTNHIVKEAVTEAMKQHQATCPLTKIVSDLSTDMWGDGNIPGTKSKVEKLDRDYIARKENVSFMKRPLFSGLVGALFVSIGFVLKCTWEWVQSRL